MEASPLVVIVGPTASGKTSLAIKLAREFGGEIICADSRTIYRGMDIGTAKPTLEERSLVPHWGLDLVEPGERFSAAQFKAYALTKISEIRHRGNIPFLVGGTGLYVDAVVYDYQFGDDADMSRRRDLESKSIEELKEYCYKNNIKLPENEQNKRYVIRAIEQKGLNTSRNNQPLSTSIIVGIATDRDVLRARIAERAEQILHDGVVEEAITLGKKYGWNTEAMTGNIYPIVHRYLEGELTAEQVIEVSTTTDWRLAKRQLTWFRRNADITWLDLEEAEIYLSNLLASVAKV